MDMFRGMTFVVLSVLVWPVFGYTQDVGCRPGGGESEFKMAQQAAIQRGFASSVVSQQMSGRTIGLNDPDNLEHQLRLRQQAAIQRGFSSGIVSQQMGGKTFGPDDPDNLEHQLRLRHQEAIQRGFAEASRGCSGVSARANAYDGGNDNAFGHYGGVPAYGGSTTAFQGVPMAGGEKPPPALKSGELEGYGWATVTRDREGDRVTQGTEVHYRPVSWGGARDGQRVYVGVSGSAMSGSGESSNGWDHQIESYGVGPSVKYTDPDWDLAASARFGRNSVDVSRDGERSVEQSGRVFQPSVTVSHWGRRNAGQNYFLETRVTGFGSFESGQSRSDCGTLMDGQVIGVRATTDVVDIPIGSQTSVSPGVNIGMVHENWRGVTSHEIGPSFNLRFQGTSVMSLSPLNLVSGGFNPISGGVNLYGVHQVLKNLQIEDASD